MSGQRIIRVNRDLLRAALHLPEGTTIDDISMHTFFMYDDVAIKISHPDFSPVPPGHALIVVSPRIKYQIVNVPEFDGWGQ